MKWQTAFSAIASFKSLKTGHLVPKAPVRNLDELRRFLTFIHVKFCLLRPCSENKNYPLVEARDLPFEPSADEPGA